MTSSAEKVAPRDVATNRRVQRLLAAARKHGWTVEHTLLHYSHRPSGECWTLRPDPNPEGYTLTVYGGPNHSATVYADLPGNPDWAKVSQRYAMWLMFEHRVTLPGGDHA